MPSLEGFIEESQAIPETEDLAQLFQSFYALVDFLRNPKTFPNKAINLSTTLMWRMIKKEEITAFIDRRGGTPGIAFAVLERDAEECPMLMLPRDFPSQVRQDLVFQLGIIAYMASQARDFYTRRIKGNNNEEIKFRARAFQAEALLTLREMAGNEGFTLDFNDPQRKILEEFPNGLKSLPAGFHYLTPVHWTSAPLVA